MKKSLLVLIVLFAIGAFAFDYPLGKPQIESNAGKPAPDFVLKDQDGKDFRLSEQKGSKVLIVFYRGHWCPYCVAQLKDLAANQAKFAQLDVKIVAISVDTPENVRKVWEKAVKRQFAVLTDPELRVIRAYGVLQAAKGTDDADIAIRTSVLVDEKGIEVFRRISKTAADIPKSDELLERIRAGK
ncbi:MAG: peroxiredoxin family protein [Terriglobales bacterium]